MHPHDQIAAVRQQREQEVTAQINLLLQQMYNASQHNLLPWALVPPTTGQKPGVQQFHYVAETDTVQWDIYNDTRGNPILRCYAKNGTPLLEIKEDIPEVVLLPGLLNAIEHHWQEAEKAHHNRLKLLSQATQEIQSLTAIAEEERVSPPVDDVEDEAFKDMPSEDEMMEHEFDEDEIDGDEEEEPDPEAEAEFERQFAAQDEDFAQDAQNRKQADLGDAVEPLDSLPGQEPPRPPAITQPPATVPEGQVPGRRRRRRSAVLDED